MQTTTTLAPTSHWFSESKEEVFFFFETTLPRVGHVIAEFKTDRYPLYDGTWAGWRVYQQGEIEGVGPKTRLTLLELAEPVIHDYLVSPEYRISRGKAIAREVARVAQERYRQSEAERLLEKYAPEIDPSTVFRLNTGIAYLNLGYKILSDLIME